MIEQDSGCYFATVEPFVVFSLLLIVLFDRFILKGEVLIYI